MKKVGILGLGNIARRHIESLRQHGIREIFGFDVDKKQMTKYLEEYCIIPVDSQDELFLMSDIVSICTPHHVRGEAISLAIKYNTVCILEKPVYIQEEDLINRGLSELHNFHVFFQNRFNDAVKKAKELISSGAIGKIYYIKGFTKWHRDHEYYSGSAWKGVSSSEGGILFNQGIHNIDTVFWLLGLSPDSADVMVAAKEKFRELDIDTEDYFLGLLQIGDITYEYSLLTYGDKGVGENSIMIVGTEGSLKIGGKALDKMEYYNNYRSIDVLNMCTEASDIYGSGHAKVYGHAICGNLGVIPTIQEGLAVDRLIRRMYAKCS